jgi:putative NADPH-quinone reductase
LREIKAPPSAAGQFATMAKRILIIDGHPDPRPERLCTALCNAYSEAANRAGHDIRRLDVGALDFPLIRSLTEFEDSSPPPDIVAAQQAVVWADHIVIVLPLWLGGPPALLKGFFEQTFRYGFAVPRPGKKGFKGLLGGRSARLIVTMGMPALAFQILFGAFGIRSVERSILGLSGIRPVRASFFGGVGAHRPGQFASWVHEVRRLGEAAI